MSLQTGRENIRRLLTVIFMAVIAYLGINFMPLCLLVLPGLFVLQILIGEYILAISIVLAMGIVVGFPNLIHMGIVFGPFILWMIYSLKSKQSGKVIFVGGSITALLGIIIWISWMMGGLHPIDMMAQGEAILELQRQNMVSAGIQPAEIQRTMEVLKTGVMTMQTYMPASIIIYCLIMPYLSLAIAGRALLRHGTIIFQPPSFSLFRLPRNFLGGTVITALGYLLFRTQMAEYSEVVLVNLIAVFSFLFLVQGLALVDFWLTTKNSTRALKFVAILLCMIVPILNIGTMIAGFLDCVMNFRKI